MKPLMLDVPRTWSRQFIRYTQQISFPPAVHPQEILDFANVKLSPRLPISFRIASLALGQSYDGLVLVKQHWNKAKHNQNVCIVYTPGAPFIKILTPAWIIDNIPSKVWDEITYPFPNFNGATLYTGCDYLFM